MIMKDVNTKRHWVMIICEFFCVLLATFSKYKIISIHEVQNKKLIKRGYWEEAVAEARNEPKVCIQGEAKCWNILGLKREAGGHKCIQRLSKIITWPVDLTRLRSWGLDLCILVE